MNKGHQQQYGRGFVLAAVALAGFGLVNAQPTQAATSASGSASQAVEQASAVKQVAAKDQTLVFALLNGIAANYHQAITVQIVAADNGQVVATKTLACQTALFTHRGRQPKLKWTSILIKEASGRSNSLTSRPSSPWQT